MLLLVMLLFCIRLLVSARNRAFWFFFLLWKNNGPFRLINSSIIWSLLLPYLLIGICLPEILNNRKNISPPVLESCLRFCFESKAIPPLHRVSLYEKALVNTLLLDYFFPRLVVKKILMSSFCFHLIEQKLFFYPYHHSSISVSSVHSFIKY